MNRALTSNAELTFEMTHDIGLDTKSNTILDDTEQLLEIRRGNISQQEMKKAFAPIKSRASPRIARKLRFSKDVPVQEVEEEEEEDMDTN
jgi:hypothetical protein